MTTVLKDHWPLIVKIGAPALVVLLTSVINHFRDPDNDPSTPPPAWVRGLQFLLDLVAVRAPKGMVGIGQSRWSLPGIPSRKAKGKKMALPPTALLPVIFMISSCACWTPEHRNDKACVILQQTITCTKDAVLGGLSNAAVAVIGQFVNGATTVDWDGLLVALEAAGVKDGGCILAGLYADFVSKPAATAEHIAKANGLGQALDKFKRDMKIEGVRYCVALSTGAKVCR